MAFNPLKKLVITNVYSDESETMVVMSLDKIETNHNAKDLISELESLLQYLKSTQFDREQLLKELKGH